MAEESIFLTFVRSTLKQWTGFQVGISEGMGGPYAREKEVWLGNEIENYFKSYNDVKPDELEDYIGTMIENEFDILFEDGSLLETSKLFCKAYPLSLENPNAPMFQASKKLKSAKVEIPSSSKVENGEEAAENIENKIEKMNSVTEKLDIKDPEEDGWTVVNRKHKK